jgi:hypothetical protein
MRRLRLGRGVPAAFFVTMQLREGVMHAFAMSTLIFAIVLGGGIAGMGLRRRLPPEHLVPEAKETVRLATGLIVTMTALVLGMLVSSAKGYYDGQKTVVAQLSSQLIQLNGLFVDYGPEAKPMSEAAYHYAEDAMDRIWPKAKSGSSQLEPVNYAQKLNEEVERLVPKDERQAATKGQIVAAIRNMRTAYWLMFLESEQASISIPLLVVVTSWLVAIFVSFGMFAPSNATVRMTLLVCALAVSGAIFIIMEMYSPFSGILRVSPVAVQDALNQMGNGG